MPETDARPAPSAEARRLISTLIGRTMLNRDHTEVSRALSAYVAGLEAEVAAERAGYEAALGALRDHNAENCPMDHYPTDPMPKACALCGADADDDRCRAWSVSVHGGLLGVLKAAHDKTVAAALARLGAEP